jgi:hypothetical protein
MYATAEERRDYMREYRKTKSGQASCQRYDAKSTRKTEWEKVHRAVGSPEYNAHKDYIIERYQLRKEMRMMLRAFNV